MIIYLIESASCPHTSSTVKTHCCWVFTGVFKEQRACHTFTFARSSIVIDRSIYTYPTASIEMLNHGHINKVTQAVVSLQSIFESSKVTTIVQCTELRNPRSKAPTRPSLPCSCEVKSVCHPPSTTTAPRRRDRCLSRSASRRCSCGKASRRESRRR